MLVTSGPAPAAASACIRIPGERHRGGRKQPLHKVPYLDASDGVQQADAVRRLSPPESSDGRSSRCGADITALNDYGSTLVRIRTRNFNASGNTLTCSFLPAMIMAALA